VREGVELGVAHVAAQALAEQRVREPAHLAALRQRHLVVGHPEAGQWVRAAGAAGATAIGEPGDPDLRLDPVLLAAAKGGEEPEDEQRCAPDPLEDLGVGQQLHPEVLAVAGSALPIALEGSAPAIDDRL
jgi:hypothetical protein